MELNLYIMGGAAAFLAGMVVYHDIHVEYMRRYQAKKNRKRDHTRKWCQCRVV